MTGKGEGDRGCTGALFSVVSSPMLTSMAESPTIGALVTSDAIDRVEITAAVDAVLADPSPKTYVLGERFSLNLSAAVAADPFAVKTLKRMNAGLAARRAAVRTAIVLGRPEKV
jgi:hypothetical protein